MKRTQSKKDWLAEAVSQAIRSTKYCVDGCLPVVAPGLVVEGLGPVKLPLKRSPAKALIAQCQVAPYGKGTRTLVDRTVRNTFELDPKNSDSTRSGLRRSRMRPGLQVAGQ